MFALPATNKPQYGHELNTFPSRCRQSLAICWTRSLIFSHHTKMLKGAGITLLMLFRIAKAMSS